MTLLTKLYQSSPHPHLIFILGAIIVGGLLGWTNKWVDIRFSTLFLLLPVLATMAGILSTWSP